MWGTCFLGCVYVCMCVSVLQGLYLGAKFWGGGYVYLQIQYKISVCFLKWYLLLSKVLRILSQPHLTNHSYCQSFYFSHSGGCVELSCGLNLHFPSGFRGCLLFIWIKAIGDPLSQSRYSRSDITFPLNCLCFSPIFWIKALY